MARPENPRQQNIENGNFYKDLLQRLMIPRNHKLRQETERETEDDIELSLGLSLNGKFGVDPKATKLTRSSSIPDFIINNPTRENNGFMLPLVRSTSSSSGGTNLARTCSLPTETDEEWRKRKEVQMLRRMEAKRKRSEKQRNFKALRDGKDDIFEENKRENGSIDYSNPNHYHHQQQFVKNFNGLFGISREGILPPSSQGSIGSQGSGSSALSESDSQPVQGLNKCSEEPIPVSIRSLSEPMLRPTTDGKSCSPPSVAMDNGKPTFTTNAAKETARNVLEDMPCVSTKGDGPNGRKIEGFLYRYKKGEEVRIVCVCHGSFLSPAEFVKHAGGGDVAHPLKHIVVNPCSLL